MGFMRAESWTWDDVRDQFAAAQLDTTMAPQTPGVAPSTPRGGLHLAASTSSSSAQPPLPARSLQTASSSDCASSSSDSSSSSAPSVPQKAPPTKKIDDKGETEDSIDWFHIGGIINIVSDTSGGIPLPACRLGSGVPFAGAIKGTGTGRSTAPPQPWCKHCVAAVGVPIG